MSSAKRSHVRSPRRWSKVERPPAAHRGREHWVVRWIGVANRRAPKPADEIVIEAPRTYIIQLRWADIFGRPTYIEPAGILRSARTIVRLMPRRGR